VNFDDIADFLNLKKNDSFKNLMGSVGVILAALLAAVQAFNSVVGQ
jgi:hypothetical protein